MSTIAYLTGNESHFNIISDIKLSSKEEKAAEGVIRRHLTAYVIPKLGKSVPTQLYSIGMKTKLVCDEPNCTGHYIIDNHAELVCDICNVIAPIDVYFNYVEEQVEEEDEKDEDFESVSDLIGSPALFENPIPEEQVGLNETQLLTTFKSRGKYISCTHNGITYDSTWELLTQVWAEKNGRNLVYHSKKAFFTLPDGRTYEGDFYDEDRNVVIEVKGKEYGNQAEKREAVMNYFHVRIETWYGPDLIEKGVSLPFHGVTKSMKKGRSIQSELYTGNWRRIQQNHRLGNILSLIKTGTTEILEIAKTLNIARATLYRDVDFLVEKGRISKTKEGRTTFLALLAKK